MSIGLLYEYSTGVHVRVRTCSTSVFANFVRAKGSNERPIKGTYVPIDQHGLNGWENTTSDVLWTYRFRHTLIVAKHTH